MSVRAAVEAVGVLPQQLRPGNPGEIGICGNTYRRPPPEAVFIGHAYQVHVLVAGAAITGAQIHETDWTELARRRLALARPAEYPRRCLPGVGIAKGMRNLNAIRRAR